MPPRPAFPLYSLLTRLLHRARVSGLDNTVGSTGNVFALTESVEQMGTNLMAATNQSIALLAKANAATASLMAHPTVQLSLGGDGGLGA